MPYRGRAGPPLSLSGPPPSPLPCHPLPAVLALIRRTLTPAPAPLTAQAERFRGTAAGWLPLGGPRPAAAAARLAALAARIDPAATLRVRTLAA
jgi:hypothetical protein